MICFCRGYGLCPDCENHVCTGACVCDKDGAPQESVHGYVNPTQDRLDAWKAKWEATR